MGLHSAIRYVLANSHRMNSTNYVMHKVISRVASATLVLRNTHCIAKKRHTKGKATHIRN